MYVEFRAGERLFRVDEVNWSKLAKKHGPLRKWLWHTRGVDTKLELTRGSRDNLLAIVVQQHLTVATQQRRIGALEARVNRHGRDARRWLIRLDYGATGDAGVGD